MDLGVIVVILVALAFDYTNGFHDAANSIATVVATRVLTPRRAVAWAAFFNFAAFLVFGTDVATTIAKDVVDPSRNVLTVGVIAAIVVVEKARRKGKVAFIGECNDELNVHVSPDLIRKGLTLMGSWHYNLNDYPKIMQVIQESPLIEQLISHVLPMREIQAAFELSASHETAKIILQPWA